MAAAGRGRKDAGYENSLAGRKALDVAFFPSHTSLAGVRVLLERERPLRIEVGVSPPSLWEAVLAPYLASSGALSEAQGSESFG